MTDFTEKLANSNFTISDGPLTNIDVSVRDRRIAVAEWLSDYVIDNCETHGNDLVTLDEAITAYSVVFTDEDGRTIEVGICLDDLGDDGVAHFENSIREFEKNFDL